jgi:leucine-zipper of insertion element IS481
LISEDLKGGVGVSDVSAPTPEVLAAHRNARTTVYARSLIVERHRAGWPAARIAEQLGISRARVHKWVRRGREEGPAGLEDRPSRPHRMPRRMADAVEQPVLAARAEIRRGAVYLTGELGLVASTVGHILARHSVPALAATDPITGAPVRRRHTGVRYERGNPGDLLHIEPGVGLDALVSDAPAAGAAGWSRSGSTTSASGRTAPGKRCRRNHPVRMAPR